MCCFLIVLGTLGPRLAFLYEWIFTDRVNIALSNGLILPLIGLIFLPWTFICYTLAFAPFVGVTGIGWLFVILGIIADVSSWGGPARRQRRSGRSLTRKSNGGGVSRAPAPAPPPDRGPRRFHAPRR